MAKLSVRSFLGLVTGFAEPEVGSAESVSNLVNHQTKGRLEQPQGAASAFASNPVPVTDASLGISGLTLAGIRTFYVPDHGGQTITAVFGTYTKSSLNLTVPVTKAAAGVWIRPYWNGAAWVDSWKELTDFYIARIASKATSQLNLFNDTSSYSAWINANALAGYIAIRAASATPTAPTWSTLDENAVLVTGSSWNAGAPYVTTFGDVNTNYATWAAGDYVYLFRAPFWKDVPSSLSLQIKNHLDELRFTSGGASTDIAGFLGFRTKTFGYNIDTGAAVDRLIAAPGMLDIPVRAVVPSGLALTADADALPAGTYDLKASVVLDDGQESDLRAFSGSVSLPVQLGTNSGPVATPYNSIKAVYYGDHLFVAGQQRITKIRTSDWGIEGTTASDLTPTGSLVYASEITALFVSGSSIYALSRYEFYDSTPGVEDHVYRHIFTRINPDTLAIDANTGYHSGAVAGAFSESGAGALVYRTDADYTGDAFLYRIDFATLTITVLDNTAPLPATFSGRRSWGNASYCVAPGNDSTTGFVVVNLGTNAITTYTITGNPVIVQTMILGTYVYLVTAAGLIYRATVGTWTGATLWKTTGETLGELVPYGVDMIYLSTTAAHVYQESGTESGSASVASALGVSVRDTRSGFIQMPDGSFYPLLGGSSVSSIIAAGYERLDVNVLVSPSLLPLRAQSVRLWLKKSTDLDYRAVKEIALTSGGTAFGASAVWNSTLKHTYYQTAAAVQIKGSDYSLGVSVLALNELGRTITDTGAVNYTFGATVGTRAYAIGVTVGGKLQRNKIFASEASGDGIPFYDVFPNDADNIVDVEFNDGDQLKALGGVTGRLVGLKSSSIVLLTPTGNGDYLRDIVATGVGIAGPNTLAAFNEKLYWLDHSGIYEFGANGMTNIGSAILPSLMAYSDANRNAAFAVIDKRNFAYRLYITADGTNYSVFVYNTRDGAWMLETATLAVAATADSDDSGVRPLRSFLVLGTTYLNKTAASGSVSFNYRLNAVRFPGNIDGLLREIGIIFEATGSPTLQLKLYLNDSASPVQTWTLNASAESAILPVPLGSRCHSFRVEILGTINLATQTLKVHGIDSFYDILPVGGDNRTR